MTSKYFVLILLPVHHNLPGFYFPCEFSSQFDETAATICGYLGLLLMSAGYIAIGLFASSITNNQIVAFLLALLIGVFFHFLFDMMSYGATGFFGQLLSVLSVNKHYDSLSKGVLDSKDLIFFLSLTAAGLFLSELFISKRAK